MSRMATPTAYKIASLCPPVPYPNMISKFHGKWIEVINTTTI